MLKCQVVGWSMYASGADWKVCCLLEKKRLVHRSLAGCVPVAFSWSLHKHAGAWLEGTKERKKRCQVRSRDESTMQLACLRHACEVEKKTAAGLLETSSGRLLNSF